MNAEIISKRILFATSRTSAVEAAVSAADSVAARSLLHYSGWIQCLNHCARTRGFRNRLPPPRQNTIRPFGLPVLDDTTSLLCCAVGHVKLHQDITLERFELPVLENQTRAV
jgi:hypothetical protein